MNKKSNIIVIVIIVILLLIIAFLLGKSSNNSINNNQGVGSAGISLQEFQDINYGDSETTVYKIIDPNNLLNDDNTYDKTISEISKTNTNHVYTYTQKILGEKCGYAEITYTADYSNGDLFVLPTVTSKESYNLK